MWERPSQLAILLLLLGATTIVDAADDSDADGVGDVLVEAPRDDGKAPAAFKTEVEVEDLIDRGEQLASGLGASVGVGVRRSGADGSGAEVTVRGASAGQVLVTLGGVPINPARGGGLDLDLIPPGLLGAATLHRGGSALRFGRGAIGGALELEPRSGQGTWASAGAGSFGTARFGAGVSVGDRDLSGLVAVDALHSDGDFGFDDGQGTPLRRVNADVDRVGAVASATWRPTPRWRLRLTNLGSFADRGRPGPAEFQVALDGARSRERGNTAGLQAVRYDLLGTSTTPVDMELTAGHRYRMARYRNPTRLLRSAFAYDSSATENGLYSGAVFSVWGESLSLFAGADAAFDTLETRSVTPGGDTRSGERRRPAAGGFTSAVWEVGPVTASAGARVEAVRGVDSQLSPALGLVADVGAGVSLRGNLARAWRAPSFDELYLDEERIVGDPDLAPESAVSSDLGVRLEADRFWAEAAVFWLEIDDLILFLPVSPTQYRAQNTGAARALGAELSGQARWGPVRTHGVYTFTNARFGASPGDPLPGRPRHRVRAEVALGSSAFEVFARARARSAVFLDNFGNLRDDAATYLDVGALGRPAKGWTVAVVGENLGDVRGSEDHLQQPLPGLAWKVQVTARGVGF